MLICPEIVHLCTDKRLGTRGIAPAVGFLEGAAQCSSRASSTLRRSNRMLRSRFGMFSAFAMHCTDARQSIYRHAGGQSPERSSSGLHHEGKCGRRERAWLPDSSSIWESEPPSTRGRRNNSTSRLFPSTKASHGTRTSLTHHMHSPVHPRGPSASSTPIGYQGYHPGACAK